MATLHTKWQTDSSPFIMSEDEFIDEDQEQEQEQNNGRDKSGGGCGARSLYRHRPEWADIKPVPQTDTDHDIVAIHYSERFKDVYDYFRAILQTKEKSMRAFDLTKDALELNPANYTVWQYRRELIKALNLDLDEELAFLQSIIDDNPKNYQVWHHREIIVQWKKDPSQELEFTEEILNHDPKNYHAWQHRQWVIKTFGLFDKEIEYVESLINSDVRNNSAWNQRYFVVSNTTGFPDFILQRELGYAMEKIKLVENNESVWNYLRGVLIFDKRGLSGNSLVCNFCEDLYKNGCRSPHLLGVIVDICEDALNKDGGNTLYNAERAIELCSALENKHDVIRSRYWRYMGSKFRPKTTNEVNPDDEESNNCERKRSHLPMNDPSVQST